MTPERLAEIEHGHVEEYSHTWMSREAHPKPCVVCELLTALREAQEEMTSNEELYKGSVMPDLPMRLVLKAVLRLLVVLGLFLTPLDAHALTSQEATASITVLYAELLQRAPDPMGLRGWVAFLLDGGTTAQVRAAILASPEYQTLLAAATSPLVYPLLPPGPQVGGMHGQMVLNSQPITCPSGERESLVSNVSGRMVEIRLVRQWHGASVGSTMDILSQVFRASDNRLVAFFGQDRYSNPGGVTHSDTSFVVPFLLAVGDALRIQYACGTPTVAGVQAHVVTMLWWTWGP